MHTRLIIGIVLAIVVGLVAWKLTSRSDFYDYEDSNGKKNKKDENKKNKKDKNKKNKKDDDKKDDDKKDDDKKDDDKKKDDNDDTGYGGCTKDEIKAAKKRARQFGELGRNMTDFSKEPEAKCLSPTVLSKQFSKGIDDYTKKRDDPNAYKKWTDVVNQCKYGKCGDEILRQSKPCKMQGDDSQCCNDPDGTKGCVKEERSKRTEQDWTCPPGTFWTGSTKQGEECADKHGNKHGTEQRAKRTVRKWDCNRGGNKVAEIETDWGTNDDATWACNEWRGDKCAGECKSAPRSNKPTSSPPPSSPPPSSPPPVSAWGDYNPDPMIGG